PLFRGARAPRDAISVPPTPARWLFVAESLVRLRRSLMMTPVANAETLFGLYRDRVFRYLYRASGHLDTAHELTQEVFLRVSRAAVPAGADADLAAWLFRIARNIVLDHKRRLDRHPRAASVDSCYLATPAA